MRITWEEMQLLTGTDIVVQMIRNRVAFSKNHIDLVLDNAESLCGSLYHVRMEFDAPYFYIYFESSLDKDELVHHCRNLNNEEEEGSKYH
jgi:hypothetical protein